MKGRFFTAGALLAAGLGLAACPSQEPPIELKGQVRLTLLHTADIHSRLFPYDLQINQSDAKLGLGAANSVARIGGVARMSHILGRERARSERSLHIDGGDCFQGAPIFNFYNGEAEMRALAEMGTDVMVVANHEFDKGALNFGNQAQRWATFPIVAANYRLEDPDVPGNSALGRVLVPWASFNVEGLKVGVVGMGNLSTVTSIFDEPNRLGIYPLNTAEIAQFYVDLVRPLVDVVVIVSHLGLDVDEQMIRNTSGIDVVLGGHNHIVLQPPKVVTDCDGDGHGNHYIESAQPDAQPEGEPAKRVRRACTPRKVLLAHSGAFAKYVGRLDLSLSNNAAELGADYDPVDKFEVVDHEYQIFPVTEDVPEDPHLYNMLLPYKRGLDAFVDLDLLAGYSPAGVSRTAPAGGDSALGNMIATAMWLRQGVQTDFAFTNTTGVRADLVPGPVTIEEIYNVFPFDNSVTKMQLSGVEVQSVFDFVARRSASRGCTAQTQIAGARIVFNCTGCEDRPDLMPACDANTPCPNGAQCDAHTGHCAPQPCAEAIYIGRDEQRACRDETTPCVSDSDCGNVTGACDTRAGSATAGHCALVCGGRPGGCDLTKPDASGLGRCWNLIAPTDNYELATSNYLAGGGSGFTTLRQNTTQFDTQIQQRDALTDFIRNGKPCGYDAHNPTPDGLARCGTDADCGVGFVCACTGHSRVVDDRPRCSSDADCEGGLPGACDLSILDANKQGGCGALASSSRCTTNTESPGPGACEGDAGRCVLGACRDDVAAFHRRACATARTPQAAQDCEAQLNPCELAGETCKFLACVDERVGNFTDGRERMGGR